MKKVLTLCMLTALIGACNSSDKDTPVQAISGEAAPASTIIDNTPVEALQIGGSMLALKTAVNLTDPENAAWRDVQEYSMELGMAPPVHQSINLRYDATAAAIPVFLRAATDGNNIYLRMRWSDESKNMTTSRTDFADGAAVQFALEDVGADGSPTTSFMMGAPNGPVNIWYWKAGQEQAQNLAAGGFGSTTRLEPAGLNASSVYRGDGEWVVVFSRPLQQSGEHQAVLNSANAHMAFALWQGEQKQRDGLKHVSMGWVELQLSEAMPAL